MTEPQDWIVLGNRDHGVSWGPFTKNEAVAFAAQYSERMALPLDGACSQLETCVAYGLTYKRKDSEHGR